MVGGWVVRAELLPLDLCLRAVYAPVTYSTVYFFILQKMEQKCRRILLRLLFGLTFGCMVFFIIVCVLNLKPYLESKNYVNTSCIMVRAAV